MTIFDICFFITCTKYYILIHLYLFYINIIEILIILLIQLQLLTC